MTQKIKFAVVGCGHIGKRHAEMIARNEECELVGLVDVKSPSVVGIDQFKVPFYSSLEELLQSDLQIDVINVATPNGFHAEHGMKVLESGRHLVIEKPMSLTKTDSEKLIFKGLQNHKQLF